MMTMNMNMTLHALDSLDGRWNEGFHELTVACSDGERQERDVVKSDS